MKLSAGKALLLWLLAMIAGVAWITQTRFTADMSFFLPADPSPQQQVLVGQMKDGAVSRLLMVGIEGGDEAGRARASIALRQAMVDGGQFLSVQNGETQGLQAEREFLLRYRYHLSPAIAPQRFTPEGLKASISRTIDVVSSPVGYLFKPYLLQDPTGEMIEILTRLHPGTEPDTRHGVWVSRDGQRALLLAQSRASGADTDGQEQAIEAVKSAFAGLQTDPSLRGMSLTVSGPGQFAVRARESIRDEISRISLMSSIGIGLLLLWIYRSPRAIAYGLLPVIAGTVAAIVAVDLVFGTVHGITIGFGAALIGESVDYAIYFFVQSGRVGIPAWRKSFWPTIRLGVMTSIAGFGALLFAGFPGLAQLGVYALAGIATAAVVTRFVLPAVAGEGVRMAPTGRLAHTTLRWLDHAWRLRWPMLALTLVALVYLVQHRDSLWGRNLSALSSVTREEAQVDARLRANIGAPDARYLVLVTAPQREAALQAAEEATRRLDRLVASGDMAAYDSPTRFLPSDQAQRQRLDSLPPGLSLRADLQLALEGAPLSASRLEPFLQAVEAARQGPLLQRADLEGTAMALALDSLMTRADDGSWSIVLPLRPAILPDGQPADIDGARVRQALDGTPALFIDLKGEFETLYADYLGQAIALSLAGVALITLMLAVTLRSMQRLVRMMLPLLMTVVLLMAGLHLGGTAINMLHLVGLLMVVAVGSNYTLFFDTIDGDGRLAPDVWSSMTVAVVTTLIGFGALAVSHVPVLQSIGGVVAPGVLIVLVLAAAFITPRQEAAR